MNILGIGGLLNDAACAVMTDGRLAAGVEQKKLGRPHRPGELPYPAIQVALDLAGVRAADIDCVAVVRPLAAGQNSMLNLELRSLFPKGRVIVVEHHAAHAASACYPAGFSPCLVMTLDRLGDFRCGALWRAEDYQLETIREMYYPDSFGDLYGRVTAFLGYHSSSDEHKVQWLSTAGDPRFLPLFHEMMGNGADGWPRFDRSFIDVGRLSRGGFSARFYDAIGLADGADVFEDMTADIAASLQRAIEERVLSLIPEGGDLAVAGGLFFNVLLVAALERSGKWSRVFAQPAAGNAGTALGALYYASNVIFRQATPPGLDLLLGPEFSAEDIKKVLENCKLRMRYILTTHELIDTAVELLGNQQIIAWMQGKMEFGPRALGNRSILASPLDPYSAENLNTYIKHREPFRKFAASVPEEDAQEFFDVGPNARFIQTVGRIKPEYRDTFKAATLGDEMIRVHTVSRTDNPLFHQLLKAAGKIAGLPVLYNTSFNLFNDPLVCTPRDAVRSFYSSGIDAMIVGNFLLEK